jgi:chemotaxis protein CheX
MNVKYINPFIIATQSVFKAMLGIDVNLSKPILKNEKKTSGDVTGIMGLVGDRKGTITISFREKGAMFVYQTLIGDECSSVTPDVVDAIGELTNSRNEFYNNAAHRAIAVCFQVKKWR